MSKILVMGLPGSGKTTFSNKLFDYLDSYGIPVVYYNADHIRNKFNDWDFSNEGRLRQLLRMTEYAEKCHKSDMIAICDFVCPFRKFRLYFEPTIMVWMDTLKESRYEDTNILFEPPEDYTYRIQDYNYENVLFIIKQKILGQ